ncbi:asr5004 [Nostoc sp. PCC 7120 = FACHB-418]|nr:asr5004 [Nostoc sp. PCC 7120 = FACHB-418]
MIANPTSINFWERLGFLTKDPHFGSIRLVMVMSDRLHSARYADHFTYQCEDWGLVYIYIVLEALMRAVNE